jgi:quinolinate synthase
MTKERALQIVENLGYLIDIEDEIKGLDLKKEIEKLKKEKNAVILAHFYQRPEVQEIADFVGDSLKLSQEAAKTKADMIVFAGVHFMAETAKILSPDKTVIIPDLNAGCSLADSITPEGLAELKKQYPEHMVISYVNTSAEIKAMSDLICTSSNAYRLIKTLPPEQKIIFTPDRNLGYYIKSLLDKSDEDFVIWDGACHVHNGFNKEAYEYMREKYPDAKLIAHPESPKEVLLIADFIGSTSQLLKFVTESEDTEFIVATEEGIIYQMKKQNPGKKFHVLGSATCACGFCEFMKTITLEKLYLAMKYETPEITLDKKLIEKAYKPIKRMLNISEKLGY